MSVERQAFIKTMRMVVSATVTGGLTAFVLMSLPTHVALLIFLGVMLAYLGYVYYSITVNQLKYRKTLEEMVDQK